MTRDFEKLYDRMPPHDAESERAFIGSLLIGDDDGARRKLRHLLKPEDFFVRANGQVFSVVARMIDTDKPIDLVTVATALQEAKCLDGEEGAAFVAGLFDTVPSTSHAEFYANRVTNYSARRRGISEASKLMRDLYEQQPDEKANARIEQTIGELWKTRTGQTRIKAQSMEEILHAWVEQRQQKKSAALMTGVPSLDEFTGIFAFGQYTILAGRPSMGKSTALRWLLSLWASQKWPVGLVACEENQSKIAGNYISSDASIDNDYLAYRDLSGDDWKRIVQSVGRMSAWPFHLVDTAFTLSEVVAAVELLATERNCRIIGVDHIHLIRSDRYYDNEQREVKEISQRLKEVAKKYDVILIAAAQLSRPMKHAGIPPPPTLTDLRSSGAIEEHADAAIFLHREDYYRVEGPKDHLCQWIIAKNRNGRRGKRILRAELNHQRYAEPESGSIFGSTSGED
jgi:replicative DNA helicase